MKTLVIIVVSVLIVGCSEEEPAKVGDDASFSAMVDSQAQAMQKAKALEGVMRDAEKKRREQMGQ
ncbi:hypothetical protein [Sulfuriflexus mobilis]|uniref:hypothetical protein n=1 Tax=Sulfuriflexus mobilis TaxID=1811807 RepID=UPI000F8354DA|nr:hypothetical protein [Sulfuriflexus mobilis]